jgi:UDPglucose 6-dehydrogenase
MKVVIVGTGYVGLVSGVCFSDWGHDVVCIDRNAAKIALLRDGVMPIYEPGLDELVVRNVAAGRLRFETELAPELANADAVFIAVGTPPRPGDGEADLTAVFAVAAEIADAATRPIVIVTKSTVPVGTGDHVEAIMRRDAPDLEIAVVSNPEFLREGSAIGDFNVPDRVVIGSDEPWGGEVIASLYHTVEIAGAPILRTSRRSAEMIKYAANAFLATKITFINEIADLCERTGTDVTEIARGMGHDARIGAAFLTAGPGYGGSCFPKDTMALLRTAQDHGVSLRLVGETVAANDTRKLGMARRVIDATGGSVNGLRVAILGLAFKADTDDMRDSPALPLIGALQAAGATIVAHDPEAIEQARGLLRGVWFEDDLYRCIEGADVAVIVTEWNAYRNLDLARLRAVLKTPVVVDLRNVVDPGAAEAQGLTLINIGNAGRIGRPGRSDDRPAATILFHPAAEGPQGPLTGTRL